ncbi:MAG: hypothetical protein DRR08_28940 [Candidatus Parabeggiatoa sp. nov. 2]|nr:MAG: hypothetical protein B6247_27765 [Beggiatoa sp. 4572_84]RKZ51759.1 MAG: hypothetical protein DRR08_28940 [Gammaproteobacteria bacterium]HEC85733.1 hypothetical protein [Thioploca sp.]
MEITDRDYSVKYDAETTTIYWQGIMRLNSTGYKPITQLLGEVAALQPSQIILDLRKLEAFNSSGVTMLARFLRNTGKKTAILLIIKATQDIPWQKKSVRHFQQVVPKLQIEWE